jgi:RND family efflux transporter MFP subunit
MTRGIVLAVLMSVAAAAQAALPFATAKVQYRDVDQTYAAEAYVEAVKQSTVSAQISGRVVEVLFDVGDYVKKGDVIARIDEREVAQAYAGSQAQAAQAQATLVNAKANYERSRQLFERKFVSQAALDSALAQYKAAQAAAAAAGAGAGVAATTKGYATIVAPYSGVVAARQIEVGEMAAPGKPLMTGFDPKDLRVVASVPQYKIDEVRNAPRASVEFPAQHKWVQATSVTVLPVADARTHTTRVRLNLPEDLRGVYPGMFARAYFTTGKAKKLLVPQAAVVRRSEVTGVYVVDGKGKASLRQVRLGETQINGDVEVLAGINSGETVALDPVKAAIYLKQQAE